jgi:LacI family gluconate utilization system Gnt-I transcriptional repressor
MEHLDASAYTEYVSAIKKRSQVIRTRPESDEFVSRRRAGGGHMRMEEVARRAQVSTATVSRALRKPDSVSDETRARVLRVIREAGYVPNLVAGSLASTRTNVIAAIVPTIGNPVFAETIDSMSEVLRAAGLHLLLGNSGSSLSDEESLIATFLARRPDGIFIHGGIHTAETKRLLRNAGIPVVETGNLRDDPLDMIVSYSNFSAAKAMTSYLIEKGYRRVAFVSASTVNNDRARARQRGYKAALRKHGLAEDPRLIVETSLGFREGAEALVHLRAVDSSIDAIFFSGDAFAAGALNECLRQGIAVPGKIAIAGFDDQKIAAETVPALTTVHVPRREIGRRAAELLLTRLNGQPVEKPIVDVGFRVIERQST